MSAPVGVPPVWRRSGVGLPPKGYGTNGSGAESDEENRNSQGGNENNKGSQSSIPATTSTTTTSPTTSPTVNAAAAAESPTATSAASGVPSTYIRPGAAGEQGAGGAGAGAGEQGRPAEAPAAGAPAALPPAVIAASNPNPAPAVSAAPAAPAPSTQAGSSVPVAGSASNTPNLPVIAKSPNSPPHPLPEIIPGMIPAMTPQPATAPPPAGNSVPAAPPAANEPGTQVVRQVPAPAPAAAPAPAPAPAPAKRTSFPSTHLSHTVGFPVFSLAYAPNKPTLFVGGGGGANRSGIRNAILALDVNELTLDAKNVTDYELLQEDDGCMSIAVHPKDKIIVAGVNSPESKITAGQNANCRVFVLRNNKLVADKAVKSVDSKEGKDYQKVAKFDSEGKLLVTGSTDGKLSIWKFPALEPHIPPLDHGGEITDADFDATGAHLVSVSPQRCCVTAMSATGGKDGGKTIWSIEKPVMGSSKVPCAFRACRFGKGSSLGFLFLAINAKSRKRAFICRWNTEKWTMERSRPVAQRPITAFALR
ncbi:hypothetical protein HK102_010430 [Quaeritorhiza haematococci]|nr:hypothetical protein HK102_010430 [Quaeritorhiza haematococci]